MRFTPDIAVMRPYRPQEEMQDFAFSLAESSTYGLYNKAPKQFHGRDLLTKPTNCVSLLTPDFVAFCRL